MEIAGVILGQMLDKTTRKPVRDFKIKLSGGGVGGATAP